MKSELDSRFRGNDRGAVARGQAERILAAANLQIRPMKIAGGSGEPPRREKVDSRFRGNDKIIAVTSGRGYRVEPSKLGATTCDRERVIIQEG